MHPILALLLQPCQGAPSALQSSRKTRHWELVSACICCSLCWVSEEILGILWAEVWEEDCAQLNCLAHPMMSKKLQFPMFYLADVWMYHGKLPVCAAVTNSEITGIVSLALSSEAHLFTFWTEDVLWINEQTEIFKWTTDSSSGQLCRESKYFRRVWLLLIALWSQPANSSAVAVNLMMVQLKDLTDAISGWYNVP